LFIYRIVRFLFFIIFFLWLISKKFKHIFYKIGKKLSKRMGYFSVFFYMMD